jgi:murein DD-endopeptidase MepM/ murein hydrolase activator NlpD
MARWHWRLVVTRNDKSVHREIEMSRAVAWLATALALLLLAGLGTAGMRFMGWAGQGAREHRLSRANSVLRSQVGTLEEQIDGLRGSLSSLEEQDDYYRLLAGLEPVDSDVRAVGIGGPGETVESNPLFGFDRQLAGRAHGASEEISRLMRRARLLSFSWREARDTLGQKLSRLAATPSILPTEGYISSGFSSSRYHPILSRPRPHVGLDIVAPQGTPIVAAANGRVRFVGRNGEYGLSVEIDHGWGVVTRYAHASRTTVRPGQPVERGDVIAQVGATGLAVGPHLHYEVLLNGSPVNPRRYIFEAVALPD